MNFKLLSILALTSGLNLRGTRQGDENASADAPADDAPADDAPAIKNAPADDARRADGFDPSVTDEPLIKGKSLRYDPGRPRGWILGVADDDDWYADDDDDWILGVCTTAVNQADDFPGRVSCGCGKPPDHTEAAEALSALCVMCGPIGFEAGERWLYRVDGVCECVNRDTIAAGGGCLATGTCVPDPTCDV